MASTTSAATANAAEALSTPVPAMTWPSLEHDGGGFAQDTASICHSSSSSSNAGAEPPGLEATPRLLQSVSPSPESPALSEPLPASTSVDAIAPADASTLAAVCSGAAATAGNAVPVCTGAQTHLLSRRVAHLEADLSLLQHRKAQLERENEVLAGAAAQRNDLEVQLSETLAANTHLEVQLSEALAANARLKAECCKRAEEAARQEQWETQQAEIARSFAELQGVVSLLVRRLAVINSQHQRLADEKGAAEAAAAALRVELYQWQAVRASRVGSWTVSTAPVSGTGHNLAVSRSSANAGRSCNVGSSSSSSFSSSRARLRCPDREQQLTRTPPRRRCAPSQRSSRQLPYSSVYSGCTQPCSAMMAEFAQAKIECELLQHRLMSEEQVCAQLQPPSDLGLEEAKNEEQAARAESVAAEVQTSAIASQIQDIIAKLPVFDGLAFRRSVAASVDTV